MKKIILLTLLTLLFIPVVKADTTIENKQLIFDNVINTENDISGSAVIGGNEINITNRIDGVGILLGNNLNYTSSSDYLFMAGNNITVSGMSKDVVILGNNITLNESSNIARDAIIIGNTVSISGSISRNVKVYAEKVVIEDAQIAGNITINASRIDLSDNALIMGELSYNDNADAKISETASIASVTTYENKINEKTFVDVLTDILTSLVNIIIVFIVMLYFIPKLFKKLERKKDVIKSMGYGIIFLIFIPVIAVILLLSVFGMALSLILIGIYAILIYLSTIIVGYYIGSYIWQKLIKKEMRPYLAGLIGLVILTILKNIPYIGPVVIFLTIILGIGLLITMYERKRS